MASLTTSQVMVFSLDKNLQIISVSKNIFNTLGYSIDELKGKQITNLCIEEDKEKIKSKLKNTIVNGNNYENWEIRKQKKNGELIWVNEFIQVTKNENKEDEIIVFCTDVTKHVNAVASLKTRDKILSALNFSTETFLGTLEWQANIQEVLKRLGEALGVSRSYIFQNHTDKKNEILTTQKYRWTNNKNDLDQHGVKTTNISFKEEGLTKLLKFLQNKIVYSGIVKNFTKEERNNFELLNIKSLVIVPIFTIDKLWGFIGFDECKYERNWSETEIDVLRTAGNTLGVAIKRKHFEEELLKAKHSAEESDKLKSQFLAQISHEIRSPIHTILSFNSLIHEEIKDKINDEIEVNFKVIKSSSNRLIRTIDLILNMSEIQTGTYDYNPRDVDIYSEILLSLIAEAKITVKNRDVEFRVSKTTDDTIRNVDTYAITQIFINLIENAFKYTHKGYVEIGIHTTKKNKLEISVIDTGIGIAKEYIPKLFEPFSQEEQGYSRTFEGNGLGLALAKKYCEMIGAEIIVESEKGIGTTFRIIF